MYMRYENESVMKGEFIKFKMEQIPIMEGRYFRFTIPNKGLTHMNIIVEYQDETMSTGHIYAMVWAQRNDVEFLRGMVDTFSLQSTPDETAIEQIMRHLNCEDFLMKVFQFSEAISEYAEEYAEPKHS